MHRRTDFFLNAFHYGVGHNGVYYCTFQQTKEQSFLVKAEIKEAFVVCIDADP